MGRELSEAAALLLGRAIVKHAEQTRAPEGVSIRLFMMRPIRQYLASEEEAGRPLPTVEELVAMMDECEVKGEPGGAEPERER